MFAESWRQFLNSYNRSRHQLPDVAFRNIYKYRHFSDQNCLSVEYLNTKHSFCYLVSLTNSTVTTVLAPYDTYFHPELC